MFFSKLCELEQGLPWTAALEDIHAGMNADHIQRLPRAPCTLHVITPTVVLEENMLRALYLCRRNMQGIFVAKEHPRQHAWLEQIKVYTPLLWCQF